MQKPNRNLLMKNTSSEKNIREKYQSLFCCLNEKSRRIWVATEAKTLGWGGMTIVDKAAGIDHKTIRRGLSELKEPAILSNERIRKKGGGRKTIKEKEKNIDKELEALIEPVTPGDPESLLRRTSKSTHNLSKELKKKVLKFLIRN